MTGVATSVARPIVFTLRRKGETVTGERILWMVIGLWLSMAGGWIHAEADEKGGIQPPSGQVEGIDPQAQKIIDQQMKGLQEREAATFPCSLFPQAEIDALVGNPLDKGSYAFNHRVEDDRQYKSESCDWSVVGGEGNEVGLWVSLPRHFASGQVECSPGSTNRKITGIGDQAWWEYQKYFGMGTLRVCSATAMVEVKVTVENRDEAKAKKIAQTMAERALASR